MAEQPGLFEIMYSMRALRRFKEDPVSDAVLFQLLDSAIRAPSGQNAQDWRFLAIRDRNIMAQMHEWAQIPWLRYSERYVADPALLDELPRSQRLSLRSVEHLVHNFAKVPLVILVSKNTVSYGEVFAGALRDIGRAKVVGQTTAGRVETLHGYTFADGSKAWIAKERFDPINSHTDWQAGGVWPDVEAHAEWDEFTFENDPALVVALKLLPRQ